MHAHEHHHEGTFATGQTVGTEHPEHTTHGDFAAGQRVAPVQARQGSFADDPVGTEEHPEDGHGRFA